ncbi:MAG TPA: YihY/virulence factor BrkB family protein [Polyangiaceae bacterium]|jgi:membrane protein|nr:YihY/virulence factor BrkB family protein [Polyangiaceae bacterium]
MTSLKDNAFVKVLKETANGWDEDNVNRLAASLAYYTLLSIAPLIILTVAIAGLAFGQDTARAHIGGELASVVGGGADAAVKAIAKNAHSPGSGIVSVIVGVLVLLFGASGVFGELQSALNTVWQVAPKPGRGIWGLVKDRFFSFTLVVGVAFLLLVSLMVSAALTWLGQIFSHSLPGGAPLWQVLNFLISLAVVTALFAVMFKAVPDAKIRWHDVWVGAAVTAALFTLGKFLLGLYLGSAGVSSAYGAAGSIVALVIWVYYSAQVLLIGAEFTEVYARMFGSKIVPDEKAVALVRDEPRPASAPASTAHAGK